MQSIANYEFHEVIAAGNYSTIYKATNQSGDPVVIKLPTTQSATAVEEYYLSRIAHPSIIELLDAIPTAFGPALVIPWAAGDDLFNAMAEGTIDEHSLKIVVYRILLALHFLHSNGVAHCDIKPENIFMLRSGRDAPESTVLADFGYVRPIAEMPAGAEFLGSACYASPEAWMGNPCNEKVDMWALGITTYVAMVGFFPFRAPPESQEVGIEIMKGLPALDSPESFTVLSDEFRKFVGALLTVDPMLRPSAEEAMDCSWFNDIRNQKLGRKIPEVEIGESQLPVLF